MLFRQTRFVFLVVLWLCNITATAQNLVPDPGFEQYINCPTNIGQYNNNFLHWGTPNWGSTDYFNSCAPQGVVGIPANRFGYQPAHSGNGYVGMISLYPPTGIGEYREYVETKLTQPLKKDEIYEVVFYVSPGVVDSQVYFLTHLAIDGIGAHLSDTEIYQPIFSRLDLQPQIQQPAGQLITDTVGWTKISGYILGNGEEYITIGNFKSDAQTAVQEIYTHYPLNWPPIPIPPDWYDSIAYMYIDDVSVELIPTASASNDTIICGTPQWPLSLHARGTFTNYQWNTGAQTQAISISKPGKYSYTAKYDDLVLYDTIEVHVYERMVVQPLPDVTVCAGKPVTLHPFPGFDSYTWTQHERRETGGSFRTTVAGDVILALGDICGVRYDTIAIIHKPIPEPPAVTDTTVCLNSIITHLPVQGDSLQWVFPGSIAVTYDLPFINTSTYNTQRVYVTQQKNGCVSGRAVVEISVYKDLQAIVSNDTLICGDQPASIWVQANTPARYLWNTGATDSLITTANAGMYTVDVSNVCTTKREQVAVQVQNCDDCLWLPGAFSPNGDGLNDGFGGVAACPAIVHEYTLSVFDRWGARVFTSNNLSEKWYGHHNGIACEVGNYHYILRYKHGTMQQPGMKKGSVMLVR